MSVETLDKQAQRHHLSPHCVRILVHLLRRADVAGVARIGVDELASTTGMSTRKARYSLREAEQVGLLTSHAEYRLDGARLPNAYRVTL